MTQPYSLTELKVRPHETPQAHAARVCVIAQTLKDTSLERDLTSVEAALSREVTRVVGSFIARYGAVPKDVSVMTDSELECSQGRKSQARYAQSTRPWKELRRPSTPGTGMNCMI